MRLVRMIFGSPGLKLLSILLAWGLWYSVREDISENWKRVLPVVARTDDGESLEARVLDDRVEVVLQGPRRAIDELARREPRLEAVVRSGDVPADAGSTTKQYGMDALHLIDLPAATELRVVEMEPATVDVFIQRMEERDIALGKPDFSELDARNLEIRVKTRDTTAHIRAPTDFKATELRTRVREGELRRVMADMGENAVYTTLVELEIDPAQREFVKLRKPERLWAQLELARLAEKSEVLPLEIHYVPQDGVAPRRLRLSELNQPHVVLKAGEPPRVRLAFRGSPRLLDVFDPTKVIAFVRASDLPQDKEFGDVRLRVADLPTGIVLEREYMVSVEELPDDR